MGTKLVLWWQQSTGALSTDWRALSVALCTLPPELRPQRWEGERAVFVVVVVLIVVALCCFAAAAAAANVGTGFLACSLSCCWPVTFSGRRRRSRRCCCCCCLSGLCCKFYCCSVNISFIHSSIDARDWAGHWWLLMMKVMEVPPESCCC